MPNRRELTVFLLIAFGIAWPLFLLPILFGPPGAPARQVASLILWAAAMWAPGIAALVVTRFVAGRSLRALHLDRLGPKRMYLWAWLLPPVLVVAAGIVSWAARAGTLDLSFPLIRDAPLPVGLLVALQIVSAILIAAWINTIFALAEELGWCGYLLPALLPFGQGRAIVVTGVIGIVWHAPAVLQGDNYPTQPVLGVALMTVFTVRMGTIFSWHYRHRKSLVPGSGARLVERLGGHPRAFPDGHRLGNRGNRSQSAGLDSGRRVHRLAAGHKAVAHADHDSRGRPGRDTRDGACRMKTPQPHHPRLSCPTDPPAPALSPGCAFST